MQYWTAVELDKDISIMLGLDETQVLCSRLFDMGIGDDTIPQSWRKMFPHMTGKSEADHPAVSAIHAYREGDLMAPSLVRLRSSKTSGFFQSVASVLRTVPPGKVISYGKLARLCGFPRAARAVGRVLSGNPFMLFVPCHRVVGSGLDWGGFSGGLKMKKDLLRFEGLAALDRTALWEGHRVNP